MVIDGSAVAAGIAQAITNVSRDLAESSVRYAKGQIKKILLDLEVGFQTYLSRNYERCSKVKTLLHRVYPIEIEQAYVGGRVGIGRDIILDHTSLTRSLDKYPRLIISGIAGSGKSMFLKYLAVSLYKEPVPKIPVFLELRHLNNYEKRSLFSFICEQFSSLMSSFGDEELKHCLRTGKFILILDGLDEVAHSVRDGVCKQILDLTYKYPSTPIIISSRPDERFLSWHEFLTGTILPLDKGEVIELVRRIGHHDQSLVQNFIKQIDDKLYRTHREFVSNPLLCTMMLLAKSWSSSLILAKRASSRNIFSKSYSN